MTNKMSQRVLVLILLGGALFAGLYAYKSHNAKGGDPVAGQVIYETHCLSCHGVAGLGDGPLAKALPNPPSNLMRRLNSWLSNDKILIEHIVMPGKMKKGMPGFEGVITPEQAKDSFAYLRSLEASKP